MMFKTGNRRGQAFVETFLVMPLLLLFFFSVLYLGAATTNKIRTEMVSRYVALKEGRGEPVGSLKDKFFTKARGVQISTTVSRDPYPRYAGYIFAALPFLLTIILTAT